MKTNNFIKIKRHRILVIFFSFCLVITFFQGKGLINSSNLNQMDLVEVSPYLEEFLIQKLEDTLSSGENVIIRPRFSYYDTLPDLMYVFSGLDSILVKDDGSFPDSIASDNKFAAIIKIDISKFLLDVQNFETELDYLDTVIEFVGHSGSYLTTFPQFDLNGFNNYQVVPVFPNLILASQCDGSILKQNSLFITHLDVVQDGSRTYNPLTGAGTPNGIWTFGRFMSNMANTTTTNVSSATFIKDWL